MFRDTAKISIFSTKSVKIELPLLTGRERPGFRSYVEISEGSIGVVRNGI